jgi:protoporphyrinogen oxidase
MTLDYIVIGGGIAGLYNNYKLQKKNKNGILLEKESYFGGRVLETNFHGTNIKLGAGIITDDNKKILRLVKKLKIKISPFKSSLTSLLPNVFSMKDAVKNITRMYKKHKNIVKNMTVTKFLKEYFDNNFTKEFLANCEYHDFLESDVYYFIKYYKLKDMIHMNNTIYGISWTELVSKLKSSNCYNNSNVTKITKDNNIYTVKLDNGEQYNTKKIIMALTLKPLDILLKNIIDFSYSDYVGAIPFIRIYTYHKKKYILNSNVGGFNLVPNVLDKIIPYTDNIIMTSYADNNKAKKLKKLLNYSKTKQIKIIQKLLNETNAIKENGTIDDILVYYWNEGVHYYKPFGNLGMKRTIKKLRNPMKGIKVVGEMVSKKQGYVEGAIE